MVDRRVAGLPLEHVIGWAEFCGLRIAVDPGVFIPRRRTEFLVRQAVALARQPGQSASPLPGRGRSSLTCAAARAPSAPQWSRAWGRPNCTPLTSTRPRCACARRNIAASGGQVYEGDLYQPLPGTLRDRVRILVANVPYVPTGEIELLPPEARCYEARVALDGGPDGLDVLRRVTAAAPLWLAPGGHLLFETSERQAPLAAGIVARDGLIPRVASSGELNATVVIGTRPA